MNTRRDGSIPLVYYSLWHARSRDLSVLNTCTCKNLKLSVISCTGNVLTPWRQEHSASGCMRQAEIVTYSRPCPGRPLPQETNWLERPYIPGRQTRTTFWCKWTYHQRPPAFTDVPCIVFFWRKVWSLNLEKIYSTCCQHLLQYLHLLPVPITLPTASTHYLQLQPVPITAPTYAAVPITTPTSAASTHYNTPTPTANTHYITNCQYPL